MRTFIDTAPFIYLVEGHHVFADQVRTYILDAVSKEQDLVTSVLTIMEYGEMPIRKENKLVIV